MNQKLPWQKDCSSGTAENLADQSSPLYMCHMASTTWVVTGANRGIGFEFVKQVCNGEFFPLKDANKFQVANVTRDSAVCRF